MTLPLLLSVPHAGLTVPEELKDYCILSPELIAKDGDEGAAEIYDLHNEVAAFVTTGVARAFVDLNRARDDRRTDGVVKTHTCWNEPIYDPTPPEAIFDALLDQHYEPYHRELDATYTSDILLGVDCHTMAAAGPPIGPDTGQPRPMVCLGDGNGTTLPDGWMNQLAACFHEAFDGDVTINQPFAGGYITRTHGQHRPWVQLELSRAPTLSSAEKRTRVLTAITAFCEAVA